MNIRNIAFCINFSPLLRRERDINIIADVVVVPCVPGLLPVPPLVVLKEVGHLCVSVGGLVSGVRLDPVTSNNREPGY